MHQINLSPHILDRARRLRGHLNTRAIDLSKTAHLIVDLQIGFMEVGAPIEIPFAREIVPAVNRISGAVRQGGGINVFLRYLYDPAESTQWTSWYDRFCHTDAASGSKNAFARGAREFELWPELDVHESDWVVDKTRFSPFTPGTCTLHDQLKKRGVETVIVTGAMSNCCCESAARDAHQLNYGVIFVADANATLTDEEHNATLSNLCLHFADLAYADELARALEATPARRAAQPVA